MKNKLPEVTENTLSHANQSQKKLLSVVLIGQPNAGKTTLFNALTNSQYKTVNYPGATVDYACGPFFMNPSVTLIDTPGIHSLDPRADDEKVTLQTLYSLNSLGMFSKKSPDLVLIVVDATQPSRHLALARQLQAAGFPSAVTLTKLDQAKKKGISVNLPQLERQMGCPIIPIDYKELSTFKILDTLTQTLLNKGLKDQNYLQLQLTHEQLELYYKTTDEIVKHCFTFQSKQKFFVADSLVLHPVFGYLFFFSAMTVVFYSIFTLANPFIDFIDGAVGHFAEWSLSLLGANILSSFLVNGLIIGFGSILVFIPQIAILFFILGILEGSGYLARGAVLIDRPLQKIGLNGRSFVPILSGFACALPAMMAARNIPGKKERMITLFIIPLMQCSARLPVYGLLLALLFPSHKLGYAGLAMAGIYIGSLVLSGIIAGVANLLAGKPAESDSFQIELPDWQAPNLKRVLADTVNKTKDFAFRAGPIIVASTLVLWFLATVPNTESPLIYSIGQWLNPLFSPLGIDWRVGAAILFSFAAREVFVSSLAVMFALTDTSGEITPSLIQAVQQATFEGTQTLIFTPAAIVGLLVFFMVSLQCLSTFAVAKKEMSSWKLAVFQLFFYIVLGYGLAALTVNGLKLAGIS